MNMAAWASMEVDSGGEVPEVGTPEWIEAMCATEVYAFAPRCPEEKRRLWLSMIYQGWYLHDKPYISPAAREAYADYLWSLGLP